MNSPGPAGFVDGGGPTGGAAGVGGSAGSAGEAGGPALNMPVNAPPPKVPDEAGELGGTDGFGSAGLTEAAGGVGRNICVNSLAVRGGGAAAGAIGVCAGFGSVIAAGGPPWKLPVAPRPGAPVGLEELGATDGASGLPEGTGATGWNISVNSLGLEALAAVGGAAGLGESVFAGPEAIVLRNMLVNSPGPDTLDDLEDCWAGVTAGV